jgi:hypothetical protein
MNLKETLGKNDENTFKKQKWLARVQETFIFKFNSLQK